MKRKKGNLITKLNEAELIILILILLIIATFAGFIGYYTSHLKLAEPIKKVSSLINSLDTTQLSKSVAKIEGILDNLCKQGITIPKGRLVQPGKYSAWPTIPSKDLTVKPPCGNLSK